MEEKELSLAEIINKLKYYSKLILSKWKIIIPIVIIGAIIGFAYTLTKNKIYTAKLSFALEEKAAPGSNIGAIASQFGISIGGGSEGGVFAGDNIIELMKSNLLIEQTLFTETSIGNKKDLLINFYTDYLFNKKDEFRGYKFNKLSIANRESDSIIKVIIKAIKSESLTINKPDKKLNIIEVSMSSPSEIFAKNFCESLVSNVSVFYINTKVGKVKTNIKLLERKVDSVRTELNSAIYGRAMFSDQNVGLIRQSAAVPKIKQEMNVQILSTMYTELVKNLELSKITLARDEPLIQIIDTPKLPLEYKKPSKIINLILGAIASFVVIVLFYIIKDLFNKE